jgi:hypothetical protein
MARPTNRPIAIGMMRFPAAAAERVKWVWGAGKATLATHGAVGASTAATWRAKKIENPNLEPID